MKLENLERALELKGKRERVLNCLELIKNTSKVILNFDKQRPLNIFNQVEVIIDDRIESLLIEQLFLIEEEMIDLNIEFELVKVK